MNSVLQPLLKGIVVKLRLTEMVQDEVTCRDQKWKKNEISVWQKGCEVEKLP